MFSNDFAPFLFQTQIMEVLYEKTPTLQKEGVDFILNVPPIHFEVKCLRKEGYYNYHNILLELYHNSFGTKSDGWFYKITSDLLLYMFWANNEHTLFAQGYIIFVKKLKEIFEKEQWEYKYKTSSAPNRTYNTYNLMVPIDDILEKGLMIPINKDYNQILKKWFE
jgi:hypothetical protein